PEARFTLKTLKETYPGIKIGLISNAARSSRTYARMFRSHGIIDYFDNLTISCEVGFLKPRREIFESSLRALGVKPRDALHVGDLFKADVVGATSVGMNSALYTGLWHKYAQYMNPGEHIPQSFKPRTKILVKEVESLREIVDLAGEIRSK
ncbi:MAG: HAD-IA family hydrolase, partial [Bacteroidetes bacterium]|nr:HAD-IA family hydrolase [Bacteroidota bacterium]